MTRATWDYVLQRAHGREFPDPPRTWGDLGDATEIVLSGFERTMEPPDGFEFQGVRFRCAGFQPHAVIYKEIP